MTDLEIADLRFIYDILEDFGRRFPKTLQRSVNENGESMQRYHYAMNSLSRLAEIEDNEN